MRTKISHLIIPILIEQVFVMLLGVVNMIMAGYLGKEVLSAIGMIDAINNVIIAFFSSIAIGGTVIIARNIGAGDSHKNKTTSINAIIATTFVSIIPTLILWFFKVPLLRLLYGTVDPNVFDQAIIYFNITLITYPFLAITFMTFGILRGSGNTKSTMKISVMMNIVNVIFGYLFIFGLSITNDFIHIHIPSMGILGAALSIAIARVMGAFAASYVMIKHLFNFSIEEIKTLKSFEFDVDLLKQVFGIGVPSGLESLIFNAGKLVLQIVVVSYGTVSIASSAILWSLFGLLNIPGVALAIASPTLASQAIGRDDLEESKKIIFKMTHLTILLQCIMSIFFAIFAKQLIQLYSSDVDVINLSTKILYTLIIAMPILWGHSFVIPQGLKGGGDVTYTLIISIASIWLFRIGLGFIVGSVLGYGLYGLWIAMYVDWIFRGVLFTIRLRGNRWIHP